MSRRQKLELTWIGKEERPRLEPRILVEDASRTYHAATRRESDIFDNMLIQGDNLLALKALEADFAGKVKCVFIDPPYNTGSAFEHYDDGVEHSLWLSLMRDRLEMIRALLSENGSLWITIDDNEAHYLKVVCDEVFGRSNFVANVVWQKKYSKQNDAKWLSVSHDHILLYAKKKEKWAPNFVERNEGQLKGYSNSDNDPRGVWQSVVYTCAKTRAERPNLYYGIMHPRTGELIFPSETRVWGYDEKRHAQHVREGLIWWGASQEKDKPRLKSFLEKVGTGLVPDTLWLREDSGDNQDAKREMLALNSEDVFSTPKPERLLKKVLEIATDPGDLVLDSFGGSGTTGSVAHKMGRRWIMVELGEHAVTHIVPRLKKVIDGADVGGITEAVGWKGGGGFRFYRLAPSLLEKDKWSNWIISRDYNAAMLAEAVCKHMGFTYAPSQELAEYWNHGFSSERDFIFITTAALTHKMLAAISRDVGDDCQLLLCCKAFSARVDAFPNLTIVKIPQAVLSNCEWGRDDYSLRIANLPLVKNAASQDEGAKLEPSGRRTKPAASDEPDLFGTPKPKGA
jgi:adenine-specific DNA-methyltransferase